MTRRLPPSLGWALAVLLVLAVGVLGACNRTAPAPAPLPPSAAAPAPQPVPYQPAPSPYEPAPAPYQPTAPAPYTPPAPAPMAAPTAAPMSSAVAAQVDRGRGIFAQSCATCHGVAGEGGNAPMLIGSGALPRDPRPGNRVRTGLFRDGHDVGMFVKDNMPPGPSRMDPTNVAAVVAYILTSNGYAVQVPISPTTAGNVILHR